MSINNKKRASHTNSSVLQTTMCTIIIPIVLITFSVLMTQTRPNDNTIIQYYEQLIKNHVERAYLYELPEDARIYAPADTTITEYGTYDFIIVGAGSTGSVIANRLSEVLEWKILVVEAGTYPDDFDSIPSLWSLTTFTDYNWGYLSTPQKYSCLGAVNKQCIVPRGRGIGGTSLINELIYSRGNPKDFDRWAFIVDDPSWKYEFLLPYFKKSEDFHLTNPEAPVDLEYHGSGGPLRVNFHMPPQRATQVLIDGCKELGYNETDYNGRAELGATILQIDTADGKRLDQGSAFIKPVLHRHNLEISDKSYVVKIEIDEGSKEATGIIFTRNNRTYRASVNKEVILSAGAISSPQILLLSGVGPKEHLRKLNIPVVEDLPVGSILRDHIFCPLSFSTNFTEESESLEEEIKEWLYNGTGPLAIANAIDGAAWIKGDRGGIPGYPNLEVVASFGGASELGQKFLRWTDETYSAIFNISIENPISLTPVLLHTKSTGTIRLKSSDPFDYPLIDFNFLSDSKGEDIEALYEAIQIVLKLSQTSAFQRINATLQVRQWSACQDHEFLSKEYWYCYIRHLGVSAFHPVGSCPSGTDPKSGAVVDSNLKVFGVDRLRVADASVFPLTLSGHPNAPCTMVGEKVSDAIKSEYGARPLKEKRNNCSY